MRYSKHVNDSILYYGVQVTLRVPGCPGCALLKGSMRTGYSCTPTHVHFVVV